MTAEAADSFLASPRAMESLEFRSNKREVFKKKREDEETDENYTHMCKICKKKFVSGRAFGGHMRIHGPVAMAAAAEQNGRHGLEKELQKKRPRVVAEIQWKEGLKSTKTVDDEHEEEGEEEEEFDGHSSNPMYALRRHPKPSWRFADQDYSFLLGGDADGSASKPINSSTFLRNSRICDVCGKEFSSWKALFGHMKCHSDRVWRTHEDDEDESPEENWDYSQKSESQDDEEEELVCDSTTLLLMVIVLGLLCMSLSAGKGYVSPSACAYMVSYSLYSSDCHVDWWLLFGFPSHRLASSCKGGRVKLGVKEGRSGGPIRLRICER